MASIEFVTIEAADAAAAQSFYAAAFGLGDRLRVRESQAATSGFRGFTMSLIAAQPATADALLQSAVDAGAATVKPATKSLWGYGGAVQAPDGTIWTVASASKKNRGPATRQIDELVLQLGVDNVGVSRQFYADRGFAVAKSYGRRYVELDTGPIKLSLLTRRALAKAAGVPPEGSESHGLVIGGDAGAFTDPDGFAWEAASPSTASTGG